jgi:hypothetical protein
LRRKIGEFIDSSFLQHHPFTGWIQIYARERNRLERALASTNIHLEGDAP